MLPKGPLATILLDPPTALLFGCLLALVSTRLIRAMEGARAGSTAQGHTIRLVTGEGPLTDALSSPTMGLLRRLVPSRVRCLRREWLELKGRVVRAFTAKMPASRRLVGALNPVAWLWAR